jgi:hypothetical protein
MTRRNDVNFSKLFPPNITVVFSAMANLCLRPLFAIESEHVSGFALDLRLCH